MTGKLYAISLWQPWASLWLIEAAKVHETRHWRGPMWLLNQRILVHAAKHREPLANLDPWLIDLCKFYLGDAWNETVPRGGFIGSTVLRHYGHIGQQVEAVPTHANDEFCGNWAPGRWCWLGDHPVAFPAMIPARGQQGFWAIDQEIADAVSTSRIAA